MRICYLVAWLKYDTALKQIVVVDANLYSEPSPTASRDVMPVVIYRVDGADYAVAYNKMVKMLREQQDVERRHGIDVVHTKIVRMCLEKM